MWYSIYYLIMKKIFTGYRLMMLKAVCISLAFSLGGSLVATGLMASGGCGMKCCCQVGPPMDMQPAAEKQMRSQMGCCSGAAARPCDLQSARPFELPAAVSVSSGRFHPHAFGLAVIPIETFGGRLISCGDSIFLRSEQKFRSPPLYLQKLSLLI
jgi:hypothetical protein